MVASGPAHAASLRGRCVRRDHRRCPIFLFVCEINEADEYHRSRLIIKKWPVLRPACSTGLTFLMKEERLIIFAKKKKKRFITVSRIRWEMVTGIFDGNDQLRHFIAFHRRRRRRVDWIEWGRCYGDIFHWRRPCQANHLRRSSPSKRETNRGFSSLDMR